MYGLCNLRAKAIERSRLESSLFSCPTTVFIHQPKAWEMGWDMKREGSLLIISVVWTVVLFVLISFIKKFIRSLPPGRRLVTSDIQVSDNYRYQMATRISFGFRLNIYLHSLIWKPENTKRDENKVQPWFHIYSNNQAIPNQKTFQWIVGET